MSPRTALLATGMLPQFFGHDSGNIYTAFAIFWRDGVLVKNRPVEGFVPVTKERDR